MNKTNFNPTKIRQSDHIFALKIKTESNGWGVLKTLIVILLIALQVSILALSYVYFLQLFKWYFLMSMVLTMICCIHALSSDYNGQAKATWILFLLISFGFGYLFYFFSDKRVLFAKSKKKYKKIANYTFDLQEQNDISSVKSKTVKANCAYLHKAGNFVTHTNSLTNYYPSGAKLFDQILLELKKAKDFIFIEYFIISNGVLLNRFLDILKEKVTQGVDVRIIYDDMGSHGTIKRKTKKEIKKAGIKLKSFNKFLPTLNIALNLRDHRKIVVIDGKVSFTGGANLADEYINEKRMHGYWKDCGIKITGPATDNLTIAFLSHWQFLTNENVNYKDFINKAQPIQTQTKEVVVPFVSGPNYSYSIAQNMYANQIANANEKLYIMTPYFVPDETITNLLANKARSGVDVRIILPDVADKKFVYFVSRNNAEKLLNTGIKIYTMKSSFVHSKVIYTENSAIVGSINVDLRSFNQQFESAVYTSEQSTLNQIHDDFINTLNYCQEINDMNKKRNIFFYRILAGQA